jgi:hypothetical protein
MKPAGDPSTFEPLNQKGNIGLILTSKEASIMKTG